MSLGLLFAYMLGINSVSGAAVQMPSAITSAISSLVDIELLNTIAQISATFIAITAGFYTTKIISIVNEKSRISSRINEYEVELNLLRQSHSTYTKKIDQIDEERKNEFIEHFKEVALGPFKEITLGQGRVIKDVNDLVSIYSKYYRIVPSEGIIKTLTEILPDIVETSRIREKERAEKNKKLLDSLRSGEFPDMHNSITAIAHPSISENQDIINKMESQQEQNIYDDLIRSRDHTKNRLMMLEEITNTSRQELNSMEYPKHIRFGFISLIVFAIIGVIIPLTYGNWGEVILHLRTQGYTLPLDLTSIILILFGIGLGLNLTYIYLELSIALKPRENQTAK